MAGEVSIALTQSQIAQVVRTDSAGRDLASSIVASLNDVGDAAKLVELQASGQPVSQSTLRALLVLAAFPPEGMYRPLIDVSHALGYSPSTTHRYVSTWLAVGLIEQDPESRK